MADIEASRKARRRKILKNAAQRLQKISGQTHIEPSYDYAEQATAIPSASSLFTNSLNRNGIPSSFLQWDDPTPIENEIAQENIQEIIGDKKKEISFDYAEHLKRMESELIKANKVELPLIMKILMSQYNYIILAVFMNIFVMLKGEKSFGTSVIIPFVLIFVVRFWILRQLNYNKNPRMDSIMIAVLILCKIQSQMILIFQRLMDFVSEFFGDLSIYMFSFVLIYYGVSSYWLDIDVSFTDKIEIIVDHNT